MKEILIAVDNEYWFHTVKEFLSLGIFFSFFHLTEILPSYNYYMYEYIQKC